jgi:trehalose 6-phosphate phosphatase
MTPDLNSIQKDLVQAERLWLFLDYDGTLADFAPTPDDVYPDQTLIELLTRLAAHPRLRVTIISGRRLGHIEKLVPLSNVLLAGTYGIELQLVTGEKIDRLAYEKVRSVLDEYKLQWEQLLKGREGFYLEDKGWALAIHGRRAEEKEAAAVLAEARRIAAPLNYSETFRLLGGRKFLEITPRLAHKGTTVEYLLEQYPWPNSLLIYLGDDDKDEDAFEVIKGKGGLTIQVGQPWDQMKADFYLESPQAARRWLEMLLKTIS